MQQRVEMGANGGGEQRRLSGGGMRVKTGLSRDRDRVRSMNIEICFEAR